MYCIFKLNGCAFILMRWYIFRVFAFFLNLFSQFSLLGLLLLLCHRVVFKICIYTHSYALRMLVWQTRHIAPDGHEPTTTTTTNSKIKTKKKQNNNKCKNDFSSVVLSVSRFSSILSPIFFFSSSEFCFVFTILLRCVL